MFTYFFSLVIIIFEAICCNLFYDVFCKENSRLRKSQKVLLMLSLICCYYLCGLFLSDMLILKNDVGCTGCSYNYEFLF